VGIIRLGTDCRIDVNCGVSLTVKLIGSVIVGMADCIRLLIIADWA
jgi:hypothetical protein